MKSNEKHKTFRQNKQFVSPYNRGIFSKNLVALKRAVGLALKSPTDVESSAAG